MKNYGPKIDVNIENGITAVYLLDEEILDEPTINDIADALFCVAEENKPTKMVLSFVKVKHLSSSALGTLIRLNKRIGESGGTLRLCEIKPSLYEVFVITKLNKLFDIYEDEATAISTF